MNLAAVLVDSFGPRYLASLATRAYTKNGPGIVLTHRAARILSLHIAIGYFDCTQVAAQITKSLQRALITASTSPTTCDSSPTTLQSAGHTDANSLIFKLAIHTDLTLQRQRPPPPVHPSHTIVQNQLSPTPSAPHPPPLTPPPGTSN